MEMESSPRGFARLKDLFLLRELLSYSHLQWQPPELWQSDLEWFRLLPIQYGSIPHAWGFSCKNHTSGHRLGQESVQEHHNLVMAAVLVPPVIGVAIIYTQDGKGVRLFGHYLPQTACASNPLSLSLVAANVKCATKRMTVTAILVLGYCAGNISGPQFFFISEAPRYATRFRAVFSTFALAVVAALAFLFYMMWKNKWRAAAMGSSNRADLLEESSADITDFETENFSYKL